MVKESLNSLVKVKLTVDFSCEVGYSKILESFINPLMHAMQVSCGYILRMIVACMNIRTVTCS